MEATTSKGILDDVKKRMEKAVEATRKDFQNIRTGRASTLLVEGILVDYYNTPTPLKGLANISTPDPRTIQITPWDVTVIGEIDKAIQKSGLGLVPMNDGKLIRIAIPSLTDERRDDLSKLIRKIAEEGRVSVRASRHEGVEHVKKLEKDKLLPEDVSRTLQKDVQKLTDSYIDGVDAALKAKEAEIHRV